LKIKKTISPTLTQIFIAGAGSGFANTIVASPIELAKIRLQNQSFSFSFLFFFFFFFFLFYLFI